MRRCHRSLVCAGVVWLLAVPGVRAAAQTPQPFPRPGGQPAAPAPADAPPPAKTAAPVQAPASAGGVPSEAALGAPIYPNAVYLGSYDAGRGQRFHLFGVTLSFTDAVAYYKATLKKNGDVLFQSPPTHQFETARYRDDSMAFPPSVTIKDFTSGGAPGYPNPTPGATPTYFPTIVQIVPAPEGAAARP